MDQSEDNSQIRMVEVESIHFDPDNPRIPEHLDGSDEEAVLTWLIEDASLLDLMRSIATQGYFPGEPILVARNGDGDLEAIEGNRRLAALRLLLDPDRAPARRRGVASVAATAQHRPAHVPVVEFETRDEVLSYLGYRHVTGIKPWEPLAKARYVNKLWERLEPDYPEEEQRLRHIASLIGSGSRWDYVAQILAALHLYRTLETLEPLGENATINFSLLQLALSRAAIPSWLGLESGRDYKTTELDNERLRELATWMFVRGENGATVLGESRNMTQLAAVIADEKALHVLRTTSSLTQAVAYTTVAVDQLAGELNRAEASLFSAFSQLSQVDWVHDGVLAQAEEVRKLAARLERTLLAMERPADDPTPDERNL